MKWRRDLLDGFTLHVDVPAGANEINAELDFLSPATFEGGFSAGSSATDKMAVISWNQVLLYPKGWKSDDINYTASSETSRKAGNSERRCPCIESERQSKFNLPPFP